LPAVPKIRAMKPQTHPGQPGQPGRAEFYFALAFGLFLGLAIWKFGNPVILDTKVTPPASLADFWSDAWPLHWANAILVPFAATGLILILRGQPVRQPSLWWWLPGLWLGWQMISACKTVDGDLTAATLWQFCGCVVAYFTGWYLLADKRALNLLLIGVLLAFVYCLVTAFVQKRYEFPQSRQMLVEGEKSGWTNFPAVNLEEMKKDNLIITTNGMDVANPVILRKFENARVNGTLVYPNALAGLILMLLPVSLVIAFTRTGNLKPPIRWAVILMTVFLGGTVFFWTGSKLGWLLAIAVAGIFLLRLDWPARLKWTAVAAVLILGGGAFAVRFHHYFSTGATSVSARFDYWRAAVQTTGQNPWFGSGPGSFQRPYAQLKAPEAEMARLTHNDYLEQFSDSGIPGGLAYTAWVILTLWGIGKRLWPGSDIFRFALYAGLLAWFAQGLGEFSLYIPALAWLAFTLLGSLAGSQRPAPEPGV
jgi:hypothetical protein